VSELGSGRGTELNEITVVGVALLLQEMMLESKQGHAWLCVSGMEFCFDPKSNRKQ
jgi:hypothetical protein